MVKWHKTNQLYHRLIDINKGSFGISSTLLKKKKLNKIMLLENLLCVCVEREKIERDRDKDIIIIKHWLQLWKLRSLMICCLQTGGSVLLVQVWEPGEPAVQKSVWVQETNVPAQQSGREDEFFLLPPFVLFRTTVNWGLGEAHVQWGGQAALLILLASGNALSDTARHDLQTNIWPPRSLVKSSYTIHHHNLLAPNKYTWMHDVYS